MGRHTRSLLTCLAVSAVCFWADRKRQLLFRTLRCYDSPRPGGGMLMRALIIAGLLTMLFGFAPVSAHGGGLAADGCHMDRKTGERHCHRAPSGGQTRPQRLSGGEVYYPNCTAARSAGAAPVRRGQPGYGTHLDRDGDGVGCE